MPAEVVEEPVNGRSIQVVNENWWCMAKLATVGSGGVHVVPTVVQQHAAEPTV